MRNWLNGPPRNYIAGLDIGTSHVRAVVLGYGPSTPHAPSWMRLIHAATVPLPEAAMSGADILEPHVVARVLVDAFGGPEGVSRWAGAHLAIGLPPSTVLIRSVALAELMRRRDRADEPGAWRARRGSDFGLDAFEERVLAEAELMMAIGRDQLCVDWFRSASVVGIEHATIVTATRQHVESRVTTAALAGLRVCVVDGHAEAALRACRLWMEVRRPVEATFVVIWTHAADARTWCVHEHAVEKVLEGPAALDMRNVASWAGDRKPRIAVLAGDCTTAARGSLESNVISRLTGCIVDRFNPHLCCAAVDPQRDDASLEDAAYVVAFGLALRGVA
ncbi:conserved protein of unknown function [Pararobbsia alpina]